MDAKTDQIVRDLAACLTHSSEDGCPYSMSVWRDRLETLLLQFAEAIERNNQRK